MKGISSLRIFQRWDFTGDSQIELCSCCHGWIKITNHSLKQLLLDMAKPETFAFIQNIFINM